MKTRATPLAALFALLLAATACGPRSSPGGAPSSSASQALPSPQLAATSTPQVAANATNVIMISINNVGAEFMSLYGHKPSTTPRLERLASQAMVFDQVYAPNSWTLPGATSLMTSTQPYTHGIQDRLQNNLLNGQFKTLAEVFRDRGYATAAFTGGLDYQPRFGHLRGVADASENPNFSKFKSPLDQARRWLGYHQSKPFFLVLQGYDAHPPFQPPAPYRGTYSGGHRKVHVSTRYALRGYKEGDVYRANYIWREGNPERHHFLDVAYPATSVRRTVILTQEDVDYLRELYQECILSVDAQVADFIEGLDPAVRAHTVIMVYSEHGEMFARHGRFGRAGTVRGSLYEDVVHVPLMVLGPGVQAGHVQGLGQLIDVAPTLLDLAGLAAPATFQGKSLLPLTRGQVVNEYAGGGSNYNAGQKGKGNPFFSNATVCEYVRDVRYKLIHEVIQPSRQDPEPVESWELYDLGKDPDEKTNLVRTEPQVANRLNQVLRQRVDAEKKAGAAFPPGSVTLPGATVQKARENGYW